MEDNAKWVEKTDPKTGKKYYVNKETKETSWKKPNGFAGATATSSSTASSPQSKKPTTVAEALATGLWKQHTDAKSGKPYYINKETKQTTWDLAKELGIGSDTAPAKAQSGEPASTVTSAAAATAAVAANRYDAAAALLPGGGWTVCRDQHGGTVYTNPTTGEQTGDLALYLAVREAIAEGSDDASPPGRALAAAAAARYPLPSATAPGAAQRSAAAAAASLVAGVAPGPSPQLEDHDDWVAVMLHRPGYEASLRKLLLRNAARLGIDTGAGVAADALPSSSSSPSLAAGREAAAATEAALRRAEAAERRAAALDAALDAARAAAEASATEVRQLQCGVFYGLGAAAHGYAPPPLRPGDGRAVDGDAPGGATATDRRLDYVENALLAVQTHNRRLVATLEEERSRKHAAALCPRCTEHDPWRRLIGNVISADKQYPELPRA